MPTKTPYETHLEAELVRERATREKAEAERDRWKQAAKSRLDGSVIARAEQAEARLGQVRELMDMLALTAPKERSWHELFNEVRRAIASPTSLEAALQFKCKKENE